MGVRALGCALVWVMLMAFTSGCEAPLDERLGFDGEFCERDDQCAPEYRCKAQRCEPLPEAVIASCQRICSHFVNACGRLEAGCVQQDPEGCCRSSCGVFLERWNEPSLAYFEVCATSTLTCAQVRTPQSANLCYVQLPPLADDRLAICQRIERRARAISLSRTWSDEIASACRIRGRTGYEEDWLSASACDDDASSDDDFLRCLSENFSDVAAVSL